MSRFVPLVLFLSCAALYGQSTTGTLTGTVHDASGAVIQGATISIRNVGTNRTLDVVSNNEGDYVAPNLPAATYDIQAKMQGFRSVEIKNVVLLLNATLRNDISMEVGSTDQSVEVSAAAPVITSETSSIGSVVDNHATTLLPLNGRTLDRLLQVTAGNTSDSASNPKIGGSLHWGGTFFTVNGVGFNDPGNGAAAYSYATALTTTPSIDTIQEFKIETNVAKAEYEGSATVAIISKSGTNQIHGSLFEFNRNREFAAKNFFATGIAKPPFNRNEFGGTVGGPIIKNKTFFFGSYEGLRQRTATNVNLAVAPDAVRGGTFSSTITDPLSGLPFANNQIPTSRLDPRSLKLLDYYPRANSAGSGFNYVVTVGNKYDVNRYAVKVDHTFNARNTLSFDGNYSKGDPYFVALGTPPNYGNFENGGYTTKSGALTYTSTVSAAMVNELRYSYFNHASVRYGQNRDFNPQSIFPDLFGPLPIGGLPNVAITGYASIGDYGGSSPSPQIIQQITDNLTIVKGAHTFKMGADLGLTSISIASGVSSTAYGSFSFNGRYSGNPFADFLLGYPITSSRQTPQIPVKLSWQRYGFYAQDDWRVSRRLTVNVGLRYMLQAQVHERDGSFTNFDFGTGQFIVRTDGGNLPRLANPTLLAAYPYVGSEKAGWGSNMYDTDKNNLAPRIGFAYRATEDGKTVIRGGYGMFYNQIPIYIGIRQLAQLNNPFILTQTFEATAGTTPSLTFANPFPGTGKITANPSITAVERDIKNTLSQQWNFTVERQLAGGTGLRASYIGNRATRVPWYNYNMNLPYTQAAGTIQSQRPYQPWADITTLITNANAITHQLQVEATHRYSTGVFIQASYTWNRSIDNASIVGGPQNPYNAAADRGLADGIRNHNFYGNATYDLPFHTQNWTNYLVHGWTLATMAQLRSGSPFSVSFTPTLAGWYASRANATGADPYPATQSLSQWFNPAAFSTPAAFTFGNSGRNVLIGPGLINVDFSVLKETKIGERFTTQFRAEAFNLPNSASFSNPSTNISVPSTVGRISSTSIANRVMQFGLKLLF